MITNFYYALWANLFLEEDNPLRSTVQTQYNTGSSSLISDMAFRMFSDNIEDKEVIISNLSHFLLYAIFRCIPKPRLVQSLSKNLLDKNTFLFIILQLSVENVNRIPYFIKAHIQQLQFKVITSSGVVTYLSFPSTTSSSSGLQAITSTIELPNKILLEVNV